MDPDLDPDPKHCFLFTDERQNIPSGHSGTLPYRTVIVWYRIGINYDIPVYIRSWYRTFSDVFPSVPYLNPVDPNSLASWIRIRIYNSESWIRILTISSKIQRNFLCCFHWPQNVQVESGSGRILASRIRIVNPGLRIHESGSVTDPENWFIFFYNKSMEIDIGAA